MRGISEIEIREKFTAVKADDGRKVRCMREDNDNFFVYARGKKSYGWRYAAADFIRLYMPDEKRDETKAWHGRLKRVVTKMKTSGLWPELLPVFENLLKMSAGDYAEIRGLYWDCFGEKKADPVKICAMREKYPFAFYESRQPGVFRVKSEYGSSDIPLCNTKSMYFGKWQNKRTKEEIRGHIEAGERYTADLRVGYDVSFEYDPEKKKAWYAEEYRGCGNGHYYIAIDHSTAVFVEDD